MSPVAASNSLPAPRSVAVWVWVNLVAQVGIVVTGGLVRLTGSGLGCPTWPQCTPGSFTPTVTQPQGYHKDIEFGNRLLTFVVSVAAVAVLVVVLRWAGRPRRLGPLAAAPLLGVAAQAVLGGITVLTRLSPVTVAAHFLLSMVLVAASALLVVHALHPVTGRVRTEVRLLAAAVGALAAVVLALGTVVTGAGPHSGDAQAPARFTFADVRTLSWLHADAVWLFVGLVVALLLAVRLTDAGPAASRRAGWLLLVTLAQGAIGYSQYALKLPVPLVALHLLGASLLTVAVTAVLHAVLAGRGAAADGSPTAPSARELPVP